MDLQYNQTVNRIIGKCKAFPHGRRFGRDDVGKAFTVSDDAGKALLKFNFFEEVKPKRTYQKEEKIGGLE